MTDTENQEVAPASKTRNIFVSTIMGKAIKADPLVIYSALVNDPEFSVEKHPAMVDAGDFDAMLIADRAVRRAFNFPSVENDGPTVEESLNLLVDFFQYYASVKKNISFMPIWRPLTASVPLPPTTVEFSITKPIADSSSIETVASEGNPPA